MPGIGMLTSTGRQVGSTDPASLHAFGAERPRDPWAEVNATGGRLDLGRGAPRRTPCPIRRVQPPPENAMPGALRC